MELESVPAVSDELQGSRTMSIFTVNDTSFDTGRKENALIENGEHRFEISLDEHGVLRISQPEGICFDIRPMTPSRIQIVRSK